MLSVESLSVTFMTRRGQVNAVNDISFDLQRGEKLGVVGESGSGKSVTSYAVLKILDQGGQIETGHIDYDGIDLGTSTEQEMRDLRGREIAMIFQNPRSALNPVRKAGRQIEDVLLRHARASNSDAYNKAIDALKAVKINEPERVYHSYAHELSGGMCQRVVIAMALASHPRLLIADEPTTGLDITTEKAVMELIDGLINSRQMSAILITHDLALASQYCDRIVVMKDGRIIEKGSAEDVFLRPRQPYTKRLVEATPRRGVSVRELLPQGNRTPLAGFLPGQQTLLKVINLSKHYHTASNTVRAVDNISFELAAGESLGLVGESGCGKSTTSSMLMRLVEPSEGQIFFDGKTLLNTPVRRFAKDPRRNDLQMVFQDATDSLNPRHTAAQAIMEPISRLTRDTNAQRQRRVEELCELVGLPTRLLTRFPHQLSGGQKARVGIARAIAVRPRLLILDEPTAALDVSIQAVVLNLLADLRSTLGISYLFVSHDLRVVRLMCESVMVMKQGRIIERGPVEEVMDNPQQAYTRMLLEAAPELPARSNR